MPRREKQQQREREMRMNNMGQEQQAKHFAREQNRDISETIPLDLAKPTESRESKLDSRLFKRKSTSGFFGDEEFYKLYDKPLFHGSSGAPGRAVTHGTVGAAWEKATTSFTEVKQRKMLVKPCLRVASVWDHRSLERGLV